MKLNKLFALAILAFTFNANATDSTSVSDYKSVVKNEVSTFEDYLKQVKDFEKSGKFNEKLLTEELPGDVNLGDPKAPVKVVEYASLSCIHCKQFHKEVFYDLKKNYIDTGKVYFKYRHYPLNAPALKGAVVLNCVADKDKLAFIGSLFEAQSQWAYSKSEGDLVDKLRTISKIAGLDDSKFDTCYKDEAVQNGILEGMKKAYDGLLITSTPGIFVGGKRYLESREYETIAKYIDSLIAGRTVDEVRKENEAETMKHVNDAKTAVSNQGAAPATPTAPEAPAAEKGK